MKANDYRYQSKTLEKLHGFRDYCAIFYDMGLGKTKIIIDEIKAWSEEKEKVKFLVVTPNPVVSSWINEMIKFCGCERIDGGCRNNDMVAVGLASEVDKNYIRLARLLNDFSRVKVLVVSYEHIIEAVASKLKFDVVVLDEAHNIKNPESNRSNEAFMLLYCNPKRIILTGTPVANTPADMYNLLYWLGAINMSYSEFIFNYCKVDVGFEGNPRYIGWENKDSLKDVLKSQCLFLDKEDVLDLPGRTYRRIYLSMTPEQRCAYEMMESDLITTSDGLSPLVSSKISYARKPASKLMKLAQITGGFLKTGDKVYPIDGDNPKMDRLKEIISSAHGKCIVYAWFRHEVEAIYAAMHEFNPLMLYGKTKNKNEIVSAFNKNDDARVLIAEPSSAGIGLTLLGTRNCPCHTIIYYSNQFSYTARMQSEARCYRIGQEYPVTYYDLLCEDTVDEHILDNIKKKQVNHEAIKNPPAVARQAGFRREPALDAGKSYTEIIHQKKKNANFFGKLLDFLLIRII